MNDKVANITDNGPLKSRQPLIKTDSPSKFDLRRFTDNDTDMVYLIEALSQGAALQEVADGLLKANKQTRDAFRSEVKRIVVDPNGKVEVNNLLNTMFVQLNNNDLDGAARTLTKIDTKISGYGASVQQIFSGVSGVSGGINKNTIAQQVGGLVRNISNTDTIGFRNRMASVGRGLISPEAIGVFENIFKAAIAFSEEQAEGRALRDQRIFQLRAALYMMQSGMLSNTRFNAFTADQLLQQVVNGTTHVFNEFEQERGANTPNTGGNPVVSAVTNHQQGITAVANVLGDTLRLVNDGRNLNNYNKTLRNSYRPLLDIAWQSVNQMEQTARRIGSNPLKAPGLIRQFQIQAEMATIYVGLAFAATTAYRQTVFNLNLSMPMQQKALLMTELDDKVTSAYTQALGLPTFFPRR